MALGSAKRVVDGTRSKPGFCLLHVGWELSLCFTKHFEEISSKSGSPFALCNSHVLGNPTADHETLALKSFLSLNLQNVGVDRSREEALRTVPNHL